MRLFEKLRDAALLTVQDAPQPAFIFEVGWASTYEMLFKMEFTVSTDERGILDEALAGGRVLLCGRGGSAKTVIMNRLVKISHDLGQASGDCATLGINPLLDDLRPLRSARAPHSMMGLVPIPLLRGWRG